MFTLKLEQAKEKFFDRAKVENAVERANLRNLSKAGAFIMTSARQSIRRRQKPSAPGQPPSAHTGYLKRIYFGIEGKDGVVVGPVKLNAKGENVPQTLEFGGTQTLVVKRRRNGRLMTSKRKVRYQARPYMAPALEKNVSKIPPIWAGSVRAD